MDCKKVFEINDLKVSMMWKNSAVGVYLLTSHRILGDRSSAFYVHRNGCLKTVKINSFLLI